MTELDMLVTEMKERVVSFAFQKADGTTRHAFGTLMPDAIESFVGPSTGSTKTPNPDVVVYFDVDSQAFRSFRKDRFLGILDSE